MDLDLRF